MAASDTRLYEPRQQIVVMSFGDLAAVERTHHGRVVAKVVDEQFAIDLGRVHFGAAFPQQISLFRWPFEQHIELPAHQAAFLAPADGLLDLHQLAATALNLTRRDFVARRMGLRTLFVGITEDAQPVEPGGADEVTELLEVSLSLAGKSDDERSAQRQ